MPGFEEHEQHGGGAAAHRLTAVAGKISAPLPPLPSPSSHSSTSFPRPALLCGDEEQAPRPPSSLPAPRAARLLDSSRSHRRPGCRRLANGRAGPASAHADCCYSRGSCHHTGSSGGPRLLACFFFFFFSSSERAVLRLSWRDLARCCRVTGRLSLRRVVPAVVPERPAAPGDAGGFPDPPAGAS